jgi:hypothetical protein
MSKIPHGIRCVPHHSEGAPQSVGNDVMTDVAAPFVQWHALDVGGLLALLAVIRLERSQRDQWMQVQWSGVAAHHGPYGDLVVELVMQNAVGDNGFSGARHRRVGEHAKDQPGGLPPLTRGGRDRQRRIKAGPQQAGRGEQLVLLDTEDRGKAGNALE